MTAHQQINRLHRPAHHCRIASALKAFSGLAMLLSVNAASAQGVVHAQVLVKGLEHPWAVAFIDQRRMLVTERPGRLRLVQPDGTISAPIDGVPAVDAGGQGGLHDVLADRDFAGNRTIYLCYAEPASSGGGNSTALASARLTQDGKRLEQVKCLASCDYVPVRSWPLFKARHVLSTLLQSTAA